MRTVGPVLNERFIDRRQRLLALEWTSQAAPSTGRSISPRRQPDPTDPQMFNPAYDGGDHLHPDDAAYQAVANAVDLGMLLDRP